MFFEVKNPFDNSYHRPYLYFGSTEEIMLRSVDDVMKTERNKKERDIKTQINRAHEEALKEEAWWQEQEMFPEKTRKHYHHDKPLKDNTPKYKEWKKNNKKNRIVARERRGEQFWWYRDPEHGNLDIIPFYPEKEAFKTRKEKEKVREEFQDFINCVL